MKKLVLLFAVVTLVSVASCTTNTKDSTSSASNVEILDTCSTEFMDSLPAPSDGKAIQDAQEVDSTKAEQKTEEVKK